MNIISVAQIIASILVIILILIQERSSGLSGLFGGGGEGGFYQARRGLEKFIFYATIFLVIVFTGLAVLNLII